MATVMLYNVISNCLSINQFDQRYKLENIVYIIICMCYKMHIGSISKFGYWFQKTCNAQKDFEDIIFLFTFLKCQL